MPKIVINVLKVRKIIANLTKILYYIISVAGNFAQDIGKVWEYAVITGGNAHIQGG